MSSNRPLRLGYLISQYPKISHTFIQREIAYLRRFGMEIEVASINTPDRDGSALTREEKEETDRTYYVKRHGAVGAAAATVRAIFRRPRGVLRGLGRTIRLGGTDLRCQIRGVFYLVEALMLAAWMDDRDLRHLHVHFATPASTVAMILAAIRPMTLSITVHGPDEFYDAPGYHLTRKIETASFVCCIGSFARSQLMKLSDPAHWGKLEVSPLGVDPDLFSPRPFRPSPSPFQLVCVGRLVPAKGQHILVEAMRRLSDRGRDVRLRMVGDGPDRASLEAMAHELGVAERIVFDGAVDQDRIREIYAEADAFVLPSFAEGIPVVLMEAMAMQIPCVTTRITGIPELIRGGVDGILVAPSDVDELAAAVEELIEDPDRRRQMGEAGRRRVEEKYHLERNTRRLASIFERRLAGREAPDPVEDAGSAARAGEDEHAEAPQPQTVAG